MNDVIYTYGGLIPTIMGSHMMTAAAAEVLEGALLLLDGESDGFSIDATTYDSITAAAYTGGPVGGTVAVINTGDPTDNLSNVALDNSNLRQASTSPKMVQWDSAPYVRWTPHNLLQQSQTLGTTWSPTNTTITDNTSTAPDGTVTADTFTATASSGANILQAITVPANMPVSISAYLKKGTTDDYGSLEINDFGGNAFKACFNLVTPTVETTSASGTAVLIGTSITSAGNGWYRCVLAGSTPTASSFVFVHQVSTNNVASSAVTSGATMLAWGIQGNRGPIATPYLATTSAARIGIPQAYDPVAAQYGILVEPAATNIVLYSEQADNSGGWGTNDVTIGANTGDTTAPDGSSTADKITTGSAGGSAGFIISNVNLPITADAIHTCSAYVKNSTATWFIISVFDAAFSGDEIRGWYNISTGATGTTGNIGAASGATNSIVDIGGGWYRLILRGNLNGADTTARIVLQAVTADGSTSEATGVVTYFWGAQLELGTVATSYIPTLGSTVTRATDQVNALASTGPTISTELGIWCEAKVATAANNALISVSASGEFEELYTDSGPIVVVYAEDGGVTQANFSIGSISLNTLFKAAGRWKANNFHGARNGTLAGTPDTSGTMPSGTDYRLGYDFLVAAQTVSFITKAVFVPRAYSNVELQSLSA